MIAINLTAPIFAIYYANYETIIGFTIDSSRGTVLVSLIPIGLGVLGMYFWFIVRQLFDDFDPPKVEPDPPGSPTNNADIRIHFAMDENMRVSPIPPSAPPKILDVDE